MDVSTKPENINSRDNKTEKNMTLSSESTKPSVEEVSKSLKPTITKKTSFTDYLKSAKTKAKEEKVTIEKSDKTINSEERKTEPIQQSEQLLTDKKDNKLEPNSEVNLKDNNDDLKATAGCALGPDKNTGKTIQINQKRLNQNLPAQNHLPIHHYCLQLMKVILISISMS